MGVFDDDHDVCEECWECGRMCQQAGSSMCDECIDAEEERENREYRRRQLADDLANGVIEDARVGSYEDRYDTGY